MAHLPGPGATKRGSVDGMVLARREAMTKLAAALLVGSLLAVACSSSSTTTNVRNDAGTGGTGGTGGGPTDSGIHEPPPADGPFACGTDTCAPNQYCINPCCGGAAPACFAKPDGGTCPAGTHDGCSPPVFGTCTGGNCCQEDPCTPPPSYCADQPPAGCLLQGRSCLMLCA